MIPDLGENNSRLPEILTRYENELDNIEDLLRIKGKTLEQANSENPTWHSYYDQRKTELHTLVKYMELQIAKVRSKLFKNLSDFNQREMSDNAKNKYIDSEPAYLNMYELFLEVKEVHDKFDAVCRAFQTRGYALNNITKVVVADITNYVI